jgi:endonuclease/exonuclease/phosphatase family metal-dependent hydrolase
MPLRIATFNIEHGRGADGQFEPGRLANALALLDADVLGLQEVDVNVARTQRLDQVRLAADATGLHVAFGPVSRVGWRGHYGNALLARGVIGDVEVCELSRSSRGDRRTALLASVEASGRTLSVAATHLSVRYEDAAPQLEAALAALSRRPAPRVVLADCNMAPAGVAPFVEAAGMTLAVGPPTFPASAPRVQIDHVAVAGLHIRSVSVPTSEVSDHRPLVVEVE